jgi:hypothetical protein
MPRMLRALALTIALALSLAAQMLSPIFNPQDQAEFNAAYKASLPPELVAFMALPYNASGFGVTPAVRTRTTPAVLLAIANRYSLDTQIMLWGWDPYTTDLVRIVQGYGWVPSFGQANIPVGPGISPALVSTGNAYDPSSPPAGSIIMPAVNNAGKMALPAPYTALDAPIPIAAIDPVGFLEMPFGAPNGVGDWYSAVAGDRSPVGTVTVNSRGTFQLEPQGQRNIITGTVSVFWVKTK